jgi:hypothetical protein
MLRSGGATVLGVLSAGRIAVVRSGLVFADRVNVDIDGSYVEIDVTSMSDVRHTFASW